MTMASLLRILGRRWYVLLVGLAIAAMAFLALSRPGGAYSTQVSVVFVSPGDKVVGRVNDGNLESLVDFAAVVERKVHDGRLSDRMAENAPLYGAGVDKGYQVLLVNSGTQWENSFGTPVLTVKVVGPSPEWVEDTLNAVTGRINRIARDTQLASGATAKNMISSERVPSTPSVSYIGSTRATQVRALVALMAVGVVVSSGLAVVLDRTLIRRSRRKAQIRGRMLRPHGGTAP